DRPAALGEPQRVPPLARREVQAAAGRQVGGDLRDPPVRLGRPQQLLLGVTAVPLGAVHGVLHDLASDRSSLIGPAADPRSRYRGPASPHAPGGPPPSPWRPAARPARLGVRPGRLGAYGPRRGVTAGA